MRLNREIGLPHWKLERKFGQYFMERVPKHYLQLANTCAEGREPTRAPKACLDFWQELTRGIAAKVEDHRSCWCAVAVVCEGSPVTEGY